MMDGSIASFAHCLAGPATSFSLSRPQLGSPSSTPHHRTGPAATVAVEPAPDDIDTETASLRPHHHNPPHRRA